MERLKQLELERCAYLEACAEITMCTGDRITYPQQGCNMEISVICIDQKLVLVRLVTLGMLREERRNL